MREDVGMKRSVPKLAADSIRERGGYSSLHLNSSVQFWLATLLFLYGVTPVRVFARCEDTNVVVTQKNFDNGMQFFAVVKNALEITMDFDCQSYSNASPSSKLPTSFVLTGPKKIEIIRFKQKVPNKVWFVGPCTHHWKYGTPSRLVTDRNFIYELPFEREKRFAVSQSYQGKHSHNKDSESEFAIDFLMPVGTTVCAAREGVVNAIRDDSTDGGADRSFENCANFVIVRHKDGTYANYVHLNAHSVQVKLGQKVSAGTALAKSGQSGWSTEPHLHFDVYRVVSGKHRATLPVQIRTSTGILNRLCAGDFYGSNSNP